MTAPRLWLPGDGSDLDVAHARWQAADCALGGHPLWCVFCRNQNCPERARLLRVERNAWAALLRARQSEAAHEPTERQCLDRSALEALPVSLEPRAIHRMREAASADTSDRHLGRAAGGQDHPAVPRVQGQTEGVR